MHETMRASTVFWFTRYGRTADAHKAYCCDKERFLSSYIVGTARDGLEEDG